jgi:hypothetical protein
LKILNSARGAQAGVDRTSQARLAGISLRQDPAGRAQLASVVSDRGWSKAEGERMPQISFSTDIKPLFREVDISHMKRFHVELDKYTYMSNPDNANKVLATLSPHDGEPASMPPGGPYWTADQLALFAQWQSGGYQP